MARRLRVGIVDSGFDAAQSERVVSACRFQRIDDEVVLQEAHTDRLRHGSRIIQTILEIAPQVDLVVAQVFCDRLATTPSQVAAALHWLLDQQVALINLSLGLRADREQLRAACESVVAHEIPLCASTPARGEPVFPAAYPGVLRLTGDARCGQRQWSSLQTRYADFGGCVQSPDQQMAGASIGTAHMSGHVAAYLSAGGVADPKSVWDYLHHQAAYHGPERRTG